MKKLRFNTTGEFEDLFLNKTKEMTDALVEAIGESLLNKKKSAQIFEITFDSSEIMYEVTLPRSQWKTALNTCLTHYEELKLSDECIDTWTLISNLEK
jgi:hypothetical protein